MTKTKHTAIKGKYVSYDLSATVQEVTGKVRLSVRPSDTELIGEQIFHGEESLVLGAPTADPLFESQLIGLGVGSIHSFEYTYPDYEVDNLMSLPIEFLVRHGIPADKLEVGFILNRDILVGKCTINGKATDLEIIEIKQKGGKTYAILDSNDPLRGLKIRYDLEIQEIREPTPEEVQAGTLA